MVIQWDKDDLELFGLLKVDVFVLGMLIVIRKIFVFIEQCYDLLVSILFISKYVDDKQVYDVICNVDIVGVF